MKFGAHVSIAGSIDEAPDRASAIGAEVFQIFSRSPRGGKAPEITDQLVKDFWMKNRKFKLSEVYIHTPYYINLASKSNHIRHGSINVIKEDLERASKLQAKYVMTHLGSAKDYGIVKAMSKVVEGINLILKNYKGSAKLLLELSAGSGEIIGDTFEEIGMILQKLSPAAKRKIGGVCFDTAHIFASGYDIRTKSALDATFRDFQKHIGLLKLKLFHLNDSFADLNSHVDRHAPLGEGKIGLEAFRLIINHPKLKKINAILEVPTRNKKSKKDTREIDIKILKKLRKP